MSWSIGMERGESFVPRGARGTSVLVAVALALLFCSAWTSRNPSIDAPEIEVFVTRFSMMAAFAGLAFAFRNSEVAFKPLAAFGAIFLLTHLLSGALASFFSSGSSEELALRGISSVFEGFGIALLELVLLVMAARFRPWLSAVIISAAYLLADVLYCSLLFAPDVVAAAALPAGELLSLVFVGCLLLSPRLRSPLVESAESLPERADVDGSGDGKVANFEKGEGGVPLSVALTFVALVTFVWGLVAQMSGGGNIAFFDTTSEFIVIGVRLVVVAFCLLAGTMFTFGSVATISSLIWATGLLIIAVAGDGLGVAIGGLVIKAGLYILQALVLVLAVRAATERPTRGIFVTGLASCMLLGGQVSRFGWFALEGSFDMAHWTGIVLAWAWWLLVVAVAAVLSAVASRRVAADSERVSRKDQVSGDVDELFEDRAFPEGGLVYEGENPVLVGDSPLRRRGIDFCLKFEQFSAEKHLSERERDVLFEALHGRTVEGVAKTLFLSRDTVKTYLSRAYARAGVNNKQAFLKLIDEWELRG